MARTKATARRQAALEGSLLRPTPAAVAAGAMRVKGEWALANGEKGDAAAYFREAAEHDKVGLLLYGCCLLRGEGVEQDALEGWSAVLRAAACGVREACLVLRELYGRGLPPCAHKPGMGRMWERYARSPRCRISLSQYASIQLARRAAGLPVSIREL